MVTDTLPLGNAILHLTRVQILRFECLLDPTPTHFIELQLGPNIEVVFFRNERF